MNLEIQRQAVEKFIQAMIDKKLPDAETDLILSSMASTEEGKRKMRHLMKEELKKRGLL